MSLATLLDRNKAFAATVRADVNTLVTAPQISPSIRISGYVYNTAVGTVDTVVVPHPCRQALTTPAARPVIARHACTP